MQEDDSVSFPADLLNLDRLKECPPGQGFATTVKRNTVKAMDRPPKGKWFQVHPDPAYSCDLYAIEYEGDFYYVFPSPKLLADVQRYVKGYRTFTAVTSHGSVFLWLCALPTDNPLQRHWALSRLEGAEDGKKDWIRLLGDKEAGGYQVEVAAGDLGEPKWCGESLRELVNRAFRDRVISDTDHDVIRELDGRQ